MVLPNRYQVTPNPAIATYDWIDFTEGIGKIVFYPGFITDSAGEVGMLNTRTKIGFPVSKTHTVPTNASYVQAFDLDFDLNYNLPVVIDGTGYITYTASITIGGSGTPSYYLVVNIYHVAVGGAETLIGTNQTRTVSNTTPSSTLYTRDTIDFDCTKTKFTPGEKLRLNILVYSKKDDGGSTHILYVDPTNSTTIPDDMNTSMIVELPYKINL